MQPNTNPPTLFVELVFNKMVEAKEQPTNVALQKPCGNTMATAILLIDAGPTRPHPSVPRLDWQTSHSGEPTAVRNGGLLGPFSLAVRKM